MRLIKRRETPRDLADFLAVCRLLDTSLLLALRMTFFVSAFLDIPGGAFNLLLPDILYEACPHPTIRSLTILRSYLEICSDNIPSPSRARLVFECLRISSFSISQKCLWLIVFIWHVHLSSLYLLVYLFWKIHENHVKDNKCKNRPLFLRHPIQCS